jgi:two-component system, chemotaxis family, response regulator Rcp1
LPSRLDSSMTDENKVFQILLAEDNPMDILVAKEALKRWQVKFELHVSEDGNDAIDFLLRAGNYASVEKPDLIVLDLNLPQKSGKEILSEIRNNPDISDIPVVVMTTAEIPDFEIIKDFGIERFITKPMDVQDYIQAVCSIQELLS